MARAIGQRPPDLNKCLNDEHFKFDFFQATRVLNLFWTKDLNVEKREYNYPVKFETYLSLKFPPSTIMNLQDGEEENDFWPKKMTISFIGFVGPQGVLPRHYTETFISRARVLKDTTAFDFLDMFNQRIVTLFYNAWAKYNFWISYESKLDDRFSHYFLDLIGLGTKGLQHKLKVSPEGMSDDSLIYYSGLLSQHPRSIVSLERILEDYFQCSFELVSCEGKWIYLNSDDQTCMGVPGQGKNCLLSRNIVIGSQVWDRQSSFKVIIGPVSKKTFEKFLPGQSYYLILTHFIRYYLGNSLDFRIQLVMKKEDVPSCQLSNNTKNSVQIGWTTWLGGAMSLKEDPKDAIFNASAI